MRFLLSLCAGLFIVNVAVFFWPGSTVVASHVYAQRADVNPHFLSLNKEVESRFYKTTPVISLLEVAQTPSVGESCYRLGPFMDMANYELAQAVFFNAEIEFLAITREARESLVYRVYLGSFTTQAQIDDVRAELKRKNILDHFVRKLDAGDYLLSLGIYTTEEAANRAVTLFGDKLDGVKSQQEELILPESYWLHFTLDEDKPIRHQLASMKWGEPAAKLGKHECFKG